MTAPDFRAVEQHTGTVINAATVCRDLDNQFADIAQLKADLAKATQQRDDARTELANMVNLTIEVGRLGDYLKNALDDRAEQRERADDYMAELSEARTRIQELEAELGWAK